MADEYIKLVKTMFTDQVFQLMSEGNNITYQNTPVNVRGVICICNHINFSDFILLAKVINFKMVYFSDTLNKLMCHNAEIVSLIEYLMELIPYKRFRDDDTKGLDGECIKQEIEKITSDGGNVLVFPEGEFSLNSRSGLKPFKNGLFYLSHEKSIPILPVIISYSSEKAGTYAGENTYIDYMFEEAEIIVKFLDCMTSEDNESAITYKDRIRDYMQHELNLLNDITANITLQR